jgi:hypothetical protein
MWYEFKNDLKYYNTINDFPENSVGFVYKITHKTSNRYYIGKKILFNNTKQKLTKKELLEQTGRGRKPLTKIVTKESTWKDYWGSSKEFLNYVKQEGKDNFKREVLEVCFSKKLQTYTELKYLFKNDVLTDPLSFNDNISGKYFRKDLVLSK